MDWGGCRQYRESHCSGDAEALTSPTTLMLTKIIIESFKSLERVEVELGLVNVFVGANGSGKSNLLEAIGVLSAAPPVGA